MKAIEWITQAAMQNRQVVLTVTFFLMLFGLYALLVMPRQEFPEIIVRQGLVIGVYPGATSAEVEEQLTTKVEDFLFSYEEIDRSKTYSISEEGMMYIFVELRGEIQESEVFWSQIKHGLNQLKMSLPQGVLALFANNKFGDASALILTLHSNQRTYKELEDYLDILEDELRKLPAISTLNHYGLQKEQISIYLDNEKLAHYAINPVTLLAALKMEGSISYAGDIDDGRIEMPVHLPARYDTENDLAQQIVYTDPRGVSVRLRDIARVVREYEDPSSNIQIDGNPCVIVTLEMMFGNNIVEFGREVDQILERVSRSFPPDVQINTIADMPLAVEESVGDFIKEFFIAILAVIAVTMVLLPFRVSSIAALTIPISVLIALGMLYAVGIELHTVSLAALIVVLGMVVDNTIVIIDNHVELLDQGVDRWTAARDSATKLFIPVFSATLAIIAVFIPMNFFLTGLAGDFTAPFPATIGITLGISLLVAVLVVPIMTYALIKTGLKQATKEKSRKSMLERMQAAYDRSIEYAFQHKRLVLFSSVGLILLTGIIGSQLSSKFGPKVDRNQFAVEIYLAEGSSLTKTAEAADSLQQMLLADPRVEHVTAFIGTSSPRFHTLYAPQMPASNYAQLIVNTKSVKATEEILHDYTDTYQTTVPQAHYRWKQLEFTLAKTPIEVRISGNEIPVLKQTASQIQELMWEEPGITWIRHDYQEPLQGLHLAVNKDEANRLGLTKSMIAYSIAAGMKGLPLAKVWEGDYPLDIVLRQSASDVTILEDLENLYLSSLYASGSVRARHLLNPQVDYTDGQIVRRNGVRTLTVQADVAADADIYMIFNRLSAKIEKMDVPEGISITYGGEHEMEVENYTLFLYSLITSVFLIFFILLFQFKTVRLSLLIMSIVPLCAFGALAGLLIMSYPFSITAFIGIIGLVGMVIRNGIIYLDYAEHLRVEQGVGLEEAAIAAGKRRMRPIFLTAMAAAVGVIPMIISRSPLWGPLGTVICFGLLFTMVLTLITLPVFYSVFGPKKRPSRTVPKAAVAAMIVGLLLITSNASNVQAQTILTLDECKELALERNVELKNSREEITAAKHIRKNAFSRWFPKVSATGGAFLADDPLLDARLEGGNLPVYDGNPANLPGASEFAYFPGFALAMGDEIYTGALTITQPVYAGGRIRNGNSLARLGLDVKQIMYDLTEEDVLVKTEQQYWQIISLDEKLRTIEAYEQLLLDIEKQVSDAYESGLILQNDVLKVKLNLSEVRLNKSRLTNGRQLAMMAFCQFLGLTYDSTLQLEADPEELQASHVERVDHHAALDLRGEYDLLNSSVNAARLQTKMAVGENMPTIALGASGYYLKVDDADEITNTVGFISLQLPISAWWGGAHKIAEHKAQYRIAENNRTNSADLLILQMDKAWKDLEEAFIQLDLSTLAREQAEENFNINGDAYENGLVTVSDLLEAQALLQEADDRLIDARIDVRMKELTYLQVTGRL